MRYILLALLLIALPASAAPTIDSFAAPATVASKIITLYQQSCVQTGGQLICSGPFNPVPTQVWQATATANVSPNGFCAVRVIAENLYNGASVGTAFKSAAGPVTIHFALPAAGTYQLHGQIVCGNGAAQTSPAVTVTATP